MNDTTTQPASRTFRFRCTRRGRDGSLFSDTVEAGGVSAEIARLNAIATWPDIVELRPVDLPSSYAELRTAARRLRYLRRHPVPHSYQSQGDAVRLGMSYAYEHALQILIDEFGAQPEFHALFYGPQGEDDDLQAPL